IQMVGVVSSDQLIVCLNDVFRLLDNTSNGSERLLVQMAKVLYSLSESNTQLYNVEVGELFEMSGHFYDSLRNPSTSQPVSYSKRDRAIAALAVAFSTVMMKERTENSGDIIGSSDRVKQEPSLNGHGEQEDDGGRESREHVEPAIPIKNEETENEMELNQFGHSPLSSPLLDPDPFLSSLHNEEQQSMNRKRCGSPTTIKRETERMEIIKRRMIESQWEMAGWPIYRDFKTDEDFSGSGNQGTSSGINNNNSSLPPSPPAPILFRCPLSAVGICKEERTSKEECYNHVQMLHPNFTLPFPCSKCEVAFKYKHELRDHSELHHSSPVPIRNHLYLHKLYFTNKTSTSQRSSQCPHCSFSSTSARHFLSHHSADHPQCSQPHLSCSDHQCRRRFKFCNLKQVIYHYGAVGACKGQCVMVKE
ncbi:hypothetical protein PFISCL1PPCAC_10721, partial [Pristionchus fissidentatus]